MRRKCEVGAAPADSAKLITSQGFLRGICPVAVGDGSAAGDDACGRILAAERCARVPSSSARDTGRTAPASAAPTWEPAPGLLLHPGRSPNTGGAAKLRAPILTISIRPRNFS